MDERLTEAKRLFRLLLDDLEKNGVAPGGTADHCQRCRKEIKYFASLLIHVSLWGELGHIATCLDDFLDVNTFGFSASDLQGFAKHNTVIFLAVNHWEFDLDDQDIQQEWISQINGLYTE